jgi:hypothetical protein
MARIHQTEQHSHHLRKEVVNMHWNHHHRHIGHNHNRSNNNDQTPSPENEMKRPRSLWIAAAGAILLLALTSACQMAPSAETLSRQAGAFPWPFGPSVSDGVYLPTIVEDVYSTE